MTLSRRHAALPLTFLSLLAIAQALAPQQQPVPLVRSAVAGSVHMIAGVEGFAGGNVGLSVGPDGLVLIDDQFEHQIPGILAACGEVADARVRYVINTHHHGDHTGGNARLAGDSATIIAHANVRARLTAEGQPAAALPVVTHEQGLVLHLNGEEVRVMHFPTAHTDGDSVVWFPDSNVLHMGDLFFHGMFPFVDRDSGGSVQGIERAVDALLEWIPADAKIIPGHGPLATVEDLRGYRVMLLDSMSLVEDALDAGQTLEQARADGILAEYEHLSWGFMTTDRFLDTVWAELSE